MTIHDQFTARTDVSRQRRWQLRKVAAGLCGRCGKAPLVNQRHCEACRVKWNAEQKADRHAKVTV